jgi:5'-nucleotidase
MEKKIVYVDMDDTLCDFMGAFRRDATANPAIGFPQSRYRFFAELDPIEGAIESYRKLEEKYDVYILSSPSVTNLMCYTEKAEWIRKHLGFKTQEKLILCRNKSLLMGDYLIDDLHHNFKGELIRIYSPKYPNWESVLNYLM